MTKSKAKNLTDAICKSLNRLDKRYIKPGDYPGLEFWVMPSGVKTWFERKGVELSEVFLKSFLI